MAVDPTANKDYFATKNIKFTTGDTVWVSGLEFRVVAVEDGKLILEPVNIKL
jgi:hypothetical protein